jgi:hypothetical protein
MKDKFAQNQQVRSRRCSAVPWAGGRAGGRVLDLARHSGSLEQLCLFVCLLWRSSCSYSA